MANMAKVINVRSWLLPVRQGLFTCITNNFKNIPASKRTIRTSTVSSRSKDNDPSYMPKIDMDTRMQGLSDTQQYYVRRAAKEAKERAMKTKKKQSVGRRVGLFLTVFAISTYFYTIFTMKKESKFKDFDKVPPLQAYSQPDLVSPPTTSPKK